MKFKTFKEALNYIAVYYPNAIHAVTFVDDSRALATRSVWIRENGMYIHVYMLADGQYICAFGGDNVEYACSQSKNLGRRMIFGDGESVRCF